MRVMDFAGYADRVQQGQSTFDKYPENLLQSRVRYSKAYKVRPESSQPQPHRCGYACQYPSN